MFGPVTVWIFFFLWHKVVFLDPGGGWTPHWHLLNREQLCQATVNPVLPWCCRGSVGQQTQGYTHEPDLRTGGAKERHVIGVRALLCWPSSSAALDPLWEIFWCYKDLPSQVMKIDIWAEGCVPESWEASHILDMQKVCGGARDLSWISNWNDWTTFHPSQLTGDKRKMSFRFVI